jgi:outer membrane protein OmpA-like peptidoglycan-associated protein
LNVKSEKLSEEIKTNGRVSLYGIEFDYDKATLKKGSEPQLNEIAKFLKKNKKISIYVVGHTDNKGSYQYNQSLSEKRATTIVDTLFQKYQIKPERLHAIGIGPVSPDAANNTMQNMQNMQKNRRVELVLKSPLYL